MSRRRPAGPDASLRPRILTACLVGSGAAALSYEVLWLREFSLVMGNTVYALSAVLTAFLGGLALGAVLGGRYTAQRGATLRLYLLLELGIGASALLLPLGVRAFTPVYGTLYRSIPDFVALNLVQLAASALLMLLPTVLMGATLPVVTALLVRSRGDVATGAGRLYAANSFGGALGALAAGFAFLPLLGMTGTLIVAVALNVSVAGVIAWLRRKTGDEPARPAAEGASALGTPGDASWPSPGLALLLPTYLVSGFAALALEVGWARLVSLSIGSTTYGFTIILFTYITGLAAGSWFIPRFAAVRENPVRACCVLHVVVAVWSLVTLAYLGSLPVRIVELMGSSATSFANLVTWETIAVGITIAVPTLAMGGIFPLVTQLVHARQGATGRAIGSTYATNTVGNILGSLVAGFLLVPTLGMRGTIVVSAVLAGAVALAYLIPAFGSHPGRALRRAGIIVGAVALAALVAPGWDKEVVTSAPYLYGRNLARRAGADRAAIRAAILDRFELVDYQEGATTVVTVKRDVATGVLHLQVGGKSDAYSFASTQNLIAHIPLLLHGDAKRALIVGLGSGSTLGSALTYEGLTVDCVEISAEVRDAARKHFSTFTGGSVDNERANVIIADGRNHLRHAGRSYDVIISQPSNPWMSGAASLFTVEYFRDVFSHLEPGGVACSWFKSLADDGDSLAQVMRTWSDVFPQAYLFETRVLGEYVLIGRKSEGPIAMARVASALAGATVATDARRVGLVDPADVLGHLLLGPQGMRAHAGGARLNTDGNGAIEFSGARTLFKAEAKLAVMQELSRHRQDPGDLVTWEGVEPARQTEWAARLAVIRQTKDLALEARQIDDGGQRGSPRWNELSARIRGMNPRDPYVGSLPAATAAVAAVPDAD